MELLESNSLNLSFIKAMQRSLWLILADAIFFYFRHPFKGDGAIIIYTTDRTNHCGIDSFFFDEFNSDG